MFKIYGFICSLLSLFFALFAVTDASAAHPLITDDTGTMGKGRFQLELTGEFGYEDTNGITEKTTELAAILSYGATDNLDMVLGIPAYSYVRTAEIKEEGISDISVELKWRFYEKDGLSFDIKPGITFPTGDHEKGLGAGKVTYGIFFIATKEIEPWAFHFNLGYKGMKIRPMREMTYGMYPLPQRWRP